MSIRPDDPAAIALRGMIGNRIVMRGLFDRVIVYLALCVRLTGMPAQGTTRV